MATNYKVQGSKFEDLFIRRDLFSSGGLWLWGSGSYGILGNNNTINQSSPVQTISSGTNWLQVSGGYRHTAAIKTDGTLWTWGENSVGQLGDNTRTSKSSPVQTISSGTNWKQVSCGRYNNAAIKTDGTLWLWGNNNIGQLGDNTQVARSSPVQTIAGGTNWKQVISSSGDHTCAIKTDGTLWLWGKNGYGQLGNNNTINQSSPVQTISSGTNWLQVSGGYRHTAAIKTDGTLWLWGRNNYGQLGTNNTSNYSSPVQTIAAGTNWKQVSCGRFHSGAIKTDGTLWLWGSNDYSGLGKLGDNTIVNKSSPVQTIAGGTNWKQVSCGSYRTGSIKTDGTLWLWGNNTYGRLGVGTSIDKSSPVQIIAGGTNWKQVVVADQHAMATTDIY